jgi:hypothetical protein
MSNQITQITVDSKTRFAVSIPYSLKDALKKTIPSAEFLGSTKQWHVGSRSVKKLETFLAEHAQESQAAEERKVAFEEKLSKMVKLIGHTFEIKDELRAKFNAVFHKKEEEAAWYVEADVAQDAQAFVDAFNVERKKLIVTSRDLSDASGVTKKLKVIEKVIKNFKDGEYQYHDDFFFQIFLKDEYDLDGFLKKLIHIHDTIEQYVAFAEETDNHVISNLDTRILKMFDIPAKFALCDFYNDVLIDYEEVERKKIDKFFFAEKQYKNVSVNGISKELDDAKHKPIFHILSKKSGIEFDYTSVVDIERVKLSSRVAVYNAKNIPVLNSEDYVTIVYFRQNKRSCSKKFEYTAEE